MHEAPTAGRQDAADFKEVFETLPAAVLVVDAAGRLVAHNSAARRLFGAAVERGDVRCCGLIGCGRGDVAQPLAYACLTAAALEHPQPLEPLDVELDGRRVEVSAAPLPLGSGVVLQARPIGEPQPAAAPQPMLRISTLGGLRLECEGEELNGEWLHHRPGQLLKYLICSRGHRVPVEELVEALWPNSARAGITSLRQAVHGLRDRLEPNRAKYTPPRFVVARPGGYELDMSNVVVDADEFEREANAALLTLERSGRRAAEPQLARAAQLYGGEFLADEPYADWATAERDRLRELATRVLRAHAELHLAVGELTPAYGSFQRLAELEPLDPAAQRDFITVMLRRGRHASAARRYESFRRRFVRAFSYEPDFTLRDLSAGPARADRA